MKNIFGQEKESEKASPAAAPPAPVAKADAGRPGAPAKIGKTVVFRGELSGGEDLTIEGRVEGRVELKDHHLVVGETGNVSADVEAKTITVIGKMEGNLTAKERVEILASGSLVGDIYAPRLVIAEGARFRGSVDMSGERHAQAAAKDSREKKEREHGPVQPKAENGAPRPMGVESGAKS